MDGHRMRMNGWTKGQMGRWANRQSFKKASIEEQDCNETNQKRISR